jgi:hypothetical protein
MLWKLITLQKLLDSIFDDGWCSLGLPESTAHAEIAIAD